MVCKKISSDNRAFSTPYKKHAGQSRMLDLPYEMSNRGCSIWFFLNIKSQDKISTYHITRFLRKDY